MVAARPGAELRPAIAAIVAELMARSGLAIVAARPARSCSTRPSSGTAMAARPPRPRRRRELLARTEGILVDPIYTAKALAWSGRRRCAAGALDGQRVVFWHAGGLPGLFEPLD